MIWYKIYYKNFCFSVTNNKREAEKQLINKNYHIVEVKGNLDFLNNL